jgi:copper chaperone
MFKSITFEVVGEQRLTCGGCEERVEDLLKAVPGVRQVRAHSHNQRIDVLFDAARVAAPALVERLGLAGYQARVGDPVV